METKLSLISEMARKDKKCKFNNLAHLLNVENLTKCFFMLKSGKSDGVDNVSIKDYEKDLRKNLELLVEKMKKQSYKPKPVKRAYIPKDGGKERELGIPAVEDKMVQMCISRILVAIWETDFLDISYGYRPGRNCHEALDLVDKMIMGNSVNHIIDADIKGFFDNVDHEWMRKCLEERISDRNLIRLIVRFLKAGVIEDGKFEVTKEGTPQGGILSPVLANIYLHYVLDLWFEKVIRTRSRGYIGMVRYADDFIICIQYRDDARIILEELRKRLSKFNLELSEDKTKIIEFGRYALINAKSKGKRAGTFTFLGFTHYCSKGRKGGFKVDRRTSKKKFSVKMKDMNVWLKSVRNACKAKDWWPILRSKLTGHYRYYGISGNYRRIYRFYYNTLRLAFKWMNRRSQKKSFNWMKFLKYLERFPLPKPRIYHNIYSFYN